MRLVFVIPYFYPALQYGGQPKSCYELARVLVRRGHHVKVLTTDSAGASRLSGAQQMSARSVDVDGIEVIYYRNISNTLAFRYRLFWPTEFFRDLDRQLENCDVLHIHEWRSTLTAPAYRAARRRHLPYVLSPHGGMAHLGKAMAKTIFDALIGKKILQHTSMLAVVSPREEKEAAAWGVAADRMRLLPNTVFPEDYANLPPRGAFRSGWSITSKKMILFIGRLHWIKGADLLVQAFVRLQEDSSDVHLVIAGPDDGQEKILRQMVTANGVGSRVTFTGYLDHQQKLEALVDCDVLVIPSRHEVFAITALEGLMCGAPVLLSSSCGLSPMPGAAEAVYPFASGDVAELASGLRRFIATDTRTEASGAGRAFVALEFSPAAIGERAESMYEAAIERNRRTNS